MIQLIGSVEIHLANGEIVVKEVNENITETNAKKRACYFFAIKLKKEFPEATRINTSKIKAIKVINCRGRRYRNNLNHRRR